MNKSMIMPCIVAAVAGAGVGYLGYAESHKSEQEFCGKYHEVIEAYDIIKENYYAEPDDTRRIEQELVKGLVKGLDDRFTTYYTDEEFQTLAVNDSPSVVDSGFAVGRDEITKLIKVTKVDEGSQAEKMGLQEGDLIASIDGVAVERKNYPEVVEKLLGKDGTSMKLGIRRDEEELSLDFVRVNGGRKDETTKACVLEGGIGYIKFDSFADGSVGSKDSFKAKIDELEKEEELKGLVIDLRTNGGGVGAHAVDVFDLFAGGGSVMKSVEAKTNKVFEQIPTSDDIVYDIPLAVLVSGDTYSAAEVFAALVQSTERGTLIGTKTGGKGVYQYAEYLSDATAINLVEGYYYVNDLPNFNDVGLTPDIIIENADEEAEEDVQLQKALEILS